MTPNTHNFNGKYIGLMSGTSCDGIDATLVNITNNKVELLETYFQKFDKTLRNNIISVSNGITDDLNTVATLDVVLAKLSSEAVLALLNKSKLTSKDIIAIGSHGQTIRHQPNAKLPYTTQIADANIISHLSHITTIADFRRKDIAAGGQGAPLVPAFHKQIFSSKNKNLAIINIGGMANITLLASTPCSKVTGFDTGPGNVLLDYWASYHINKPYDHNGELAKSGKLSKALLSLLLDDEFFQLQPPKSTGRELFNAQWLQAKLSKLGHSINNKDVQNTLVELTAISIINEINKHAPNTDEIIICGGGAKNAFLIERLTANTSIKVFLSDDKGVKSDWIEAMAFAWLAQQTLKGLSANVMEVTGAKSHVILGAIYPV